MKNNEMKKIPLNLKKIKKNLTRIHVIEKTDTRESNQNLIINSSSLNPVKAGKKKKRVSFIDQVDSKKEIAQTIYIKDKDKDSINDNKKEIRQNLFFEQYRKQCSTINELNKKDGDVYRIKRPKKYDFIHNPNNENETAKEQCTCILF